MTRTERSALLERLLTLRAQAQAHAADDRPIPGLTVARALRIAERTARRSLAVAS